jgi:hypothetical protein
MARSKTFQDGILLGNMFGGIGGSMFTAYNTPTYIEQAQTMNGNLTALVLTGDSTSSGLLNWALEKVGRFVNQYTLTELRESSDIKKSAKLNKS